MRGAKFLQSVSPAHTRKQNVQFLTLFSIFVCRKNCICCGQGSGEREERGWVTGRRWRNLICAKKLLPRSACCTQHPSFSPMLVFLAAPFRLASFFNAIKRKLIRHRQAKPKAGKELCTWERGRGEWQGENATQKCCQIVANKMADMEILCASFSRRTL